MTILMTIRRCAFWLAIAGVIVILWLGLVVGSDNVPPTERAPTVTTQPFYTNDTAPATIPPAPGSIECPPTDASCNFNPANP